LVHGGLGRKKALLLNFLFALTALLGAVMGLLLGELNEGFLRFILPFTAGGFIYVASTDLFPELHKESSKKNPPKGMSRFFISSSLLGVLE